MDARATAELPAGARGIVFQLCEGLGVLPRRPIEQQLGRTRRGRPQGAGAARRPGRRLFALFPEHAEAGADPPARRPLDDRAQPRDHPAAAGRGPHLDGPAARRRARFLRHHRLPAAGRPRHPRRHGRAPGGDGAPGRRAKAAKPRAARSRQKKPRRARRQAPTAPAAAAAPSTDEISEWAIVAAAFGESEPAPAPEPVVEASPREAASPSKRAGAGSTGREDSRAEPGRRPRRACRPKSRRTRRCRRAEAATGRRRRPEAPAAKLPKSRRPKRPRRTGPRPLPPGWFRAAPQMMSLVGCSEPEMANVLRGLGYQRSIRRRKRTARCYAFSIKPRFVREREEQRERQRLQQQQREQREQRRRERPERPNERQFFADSPRPERGKDGRASRRPRQRPRSEGRRTGPARRRTARGRSAARRPPRAAAAAPRQRRAGAAALRHHREEERRARRRLAVRQAARAQARRKEVTAR